MMMGGDKKKGMAALIVSRMRPSADSVKASNAEAFGERAAEPESSMDEGQRSACEEMMSALERKDVEGFGQALKSFISMDDGDDDGAEPEEAAL